MRVPSRLARRTHQLVVVCCFSSVGLIFHNHPGLFRLSRCLPNSRELRSLCRRYFHQGRSSLVSSNYGPTSSSSSTSSASPSSVSMPPSPSYQQAYSQRIDASPCQFTTVFLVWLLCLSFSGDKHWEYHVKSNGDGRLAELVNLVVEDYPRVPLVLYFPVLPGEEQNGHFLKPKHWFFRCDVKHRSESEYPRQIPLWLIAFVYSGLLIWNTMHCWNHPHSHMINSLSGKAGLSEFYVHFQQFLVAVVLCAVIVCLLTAYSTDMFYKDVARRVKAFVTERRQMSGSDADAFLKAIGKQGLAYFVFVANATSDPHFLFLLFLVVCDFCVIRRIRIPFDDSLTNFEEEKFDTSMDLELTPEAPSRPINLLLNRSYSTKRRKSVVDRSSRGQDLMRLMQLA